MAVNPFDILGASEEAAAPAPATAAKKAPAAAAPAADKSRAKPTERKIKSDYPARTGNARVITPVVRDSRPPRRDDGAAAPSERRQQGPRDGATHKTRGPRSGYAARGREFDRHSGTGIRDNEKKIKAGWGGAEAELKASEDVEKAKAEGETAEVERELTEEEKAQKAADEAAEAERLAAEAEEAKKKTLDQYFEEVKAKQAATAAELNLRQANEGSDASKWKNNSELDRTEEVFFAAKAAGKGKKDNKDKKVKTYVAIEQRFNAPAISRDDDRRGPRRDVQQRTGGRRTQTAGGVPNIADASAFPTLGGSK
ncbi:hypothetical protein GQ42DRAFT_176700 [Ramicandelaber brevisporus]|nr:hypothetical protein GQ42DRAFT_176700 [Ramicandelaber brevisporus]